MSGSQCGSGNGEYEEEDPDLDAESQTSGDKGGTSLEGVSNWSDSSVPQNEEETGTNSGNGTTGTENTSIISDTRSAVDPEVSSSSKVTDGAEVKGGECCNGNISCARRRSSQCQGSDLCLA